MDKKMKNNLFMVAVDHLFKEGLVDSQKSLAEKIGISEAALSRIKNGTKTVSDDTLRKMNAAFGGIFNMAYFRAGEGCLLANGQQMNDGVAAASPSDYREKYIESLEKQIKDKDQQIADLRRDIQLLYKRLNIESRYESMQANLFGGIAADELQEPAHDND